MPFFVAFIQTNNQTFVILLVKILVIFLDKVLELIFLKYLVYLLVYPLGNNLVKVC